MAMALIEILRDRCCDCGLCARVCPTAVISSRADELEVSRFDECIGCGHCIAICPCEAVNHRGLDMDDFPLLGEEEVGPDLLEIFLRSRRSLRCYTENAIPRIDLERILRAASISPGVDNRRVLEFVVMHGRSKVREVAGAAIEHYRGVLRASGRRLAKMLTRSRRKEEGSDEAAQTARWQRLVEAWDRGEDRLLHGAPVLLVVAGPGGEPEAAIEAGQALLHVNLMALSLGYGGCMIGGLPAAIQQDAGLRELLGLTDSQQALAGMVLGEPAVSYRRGVARPPTRLRWL